jgi:hypothetical protein
MLGISHRKAEGKAKILPGNVLLGQVFVGIAGYHMFMMGHLLIAGVISTTLTIAVVGDLVRMLTTKDKPTQ